MFANVTVGTIQRSSTPVKSGANIKRRLNFCSSRLLLIASVWGYISWASGRISDVLPVLQGVRSRCRLCARTRRGVDPRSVGVCSGPRVCVNHSPLVSRLRLLPHLYCEENKAPAHVLRSRARIKVPFDSVTVVTPRRRRRRRGSLVCQEKL